MGNAPVFAKLAYVSNAVRFRKITVFFQAQVVLKQLVSLIGCLVACSARTSVDTHTHRQTNYSNPHCACTPRVSKDNKRTTQTHIMLLVHV